MTTWNTFAQMRGDHLPRDWMRWGELVAAAGCRPAWTWRLRQVVHGPGLPRPQKRYGHYRYTTEHLEAARAFAAAEATKEGATADGIL